MTNKKRKVLDIAITVLAALVVLVVVIAAMALLQNLVTG